MKSNRTILSWSVGLALGAWALFVAASYMVVDIDLFHEMALFRQIWDTGTMPLADDFAYTPTLERVVHHEWGTGAVLYAVSIGTGWGAGGIVALKYLLCFGIGIASFILAHRHNVSLPLFAMCAVVALNLGGWMAFTNIRAQLFTLAFMAALFWLIDQDRRGQRWWIAVWIPVCIVWANMHAGVVAGIGILGIYGLSRAVDAYVDSRSFRKTIFEIKHLLMAGTLSVAAININPYGWDYLPYLVRAIRMERPLIGEWSPIWESGSFNLQLMFLISLAIAVAALFSRREKSTFEMLAIGLTAYLAVKNLRHCSLYAVTWICLVPPMIERASVGSSIRGWWERQNEKMVAVALAVAIIAVGCSIKMKFWELRIPDQPTIAGLPVFPVGAVEFLRDEQFQGNLFVPFQTGAFVSWKLYPDVKVSIDSRYEVAYPEGAVEENWRFYRADENWRATLEKYETDAVLVPVNKPILNKLDQAIESEPDFGWRCVYRDAGNALFAKAAVADRLAESSLNPRGIENR